MLTALLPPLRRLVPNRHRSDAARALIRIYGPEEALRIAEECLRDCIPQDCRDSWTKHVEEIRRSTRCTVQPDDHTSQEN